MRWSRKENSSINSPKIDAFLADVREACKRHGLCVEHEDTEGNFIIEKYDSERDFEWLGDASVGRTVDDA